jgi:hypothetical protein
MENLFRPGKWLVLFCGVFIVLFGALQFVSNARLKEEAQIVGAGIFTWNWPGDNWSSHARITEANVLHKGDKDAVVQVTGKQFLTGAATAGGKEETADCSATLTFYKRSHQNKDYWELGEVQFP